MQEAAITRELQAAEEAGAGGAASRLSSLLDRGLVRLVKRDYDAAREVSACMYVRAAAQPEHDVERGLLRRTMKKRVCACLCVRSCVRAFVFYFRHRPRHPVYRRKDDSLKRGTNARTHSCVSGPFDGSEYDTRSRAC